MAKKDSGFSPASITSIRPDNDAEWIEPFNSLLVDLEEERFHSRLLKRCRRGKSARNALVQDLIELGLDTLNNQSDSENTIKVNLDGLPPETIAFLSSPQGQVMVKNLLLTFTTGMGSGIAFPSPMPTNQAFQEESSRQDKKENVIPQVTSGTRTLEGGNTTLEKTPVLIKDDFESQIEDLDLDKELTQMDVTKEEIASTKEEVAESSTEKKSKFEKWKKRGDIGRS